MHEKEKENIVEKKQDQNTVFRYKSMDKALQMTIMMATKCKLMHPYSLCDAPNQLSHNWGTILCITICMH